MKNETKEITFKANEVMRKFGSNLDGVAQEYLNSNLDVEGFVSRLMENAVKAVASSIKDEVTELELDETEDAAKHLYDCTANLISALFNDLMTREEEYLKMISDELKK